MTLKTLKFHKGIINILTPHFKICANVNVGAIAYINPKVEMNGPKVTFWLESYLSWLSSLFFSKNKNIVDNQNQALSHLRALYYLACADNELSRPEAIFIENVAEHLGISADQLAGFQTDEPKLVLPDKEYKIYSLYHRLVLVILIDNKLDKNEHTYCFNLGVRMGLHPNAVGEIIDLVETKGLADALPSDVMNIFRKYLS